MDRDFGEQLDDAPCSAFEAKDLDFDAGVGR
jgi:hypothetical protein